MGRGTRFAAALAGLLLAAIDPAGAQPAEAEIVARYEFILEQTPAAGPAFEQVVTLYREGPGLDALAQRWEARVANSREPVARRAAYAVLASLLAERRNDPDAAARLIRRATELAPKDAGIWRARSALERRRGDLPAAIASLQRALQAGVPPLERPEVLRELAGLQQRALQPEDAIATWRQLAEEFPEDPYALQEVATALADSGKHDDAIAALRQRAALLEGSGPAQVEAQLAVGRALEQAGRPDEALALYEELLPQTSSTSWLQRELRTRIETAHRGRDDVPGLIAYYQRWLAKHPGDIEARLRLSDALGELNRAEDALAALREAGTRAPDRIDIQTRLARRLLDTGQPAEAATVARALTERQPGEPAYWRLLGDAAWARSGGTAPADRREAIAAWARLAPKGAPLHAIQERAALLARHHLDDEALEQHRRALEAAPDAAEVRLGVVEFLIDRQRMDEAWATLDAMVAGKRATPANYLRLAKADRRFGRRANALAATEAGLALDANHFDLLWLRQQLLAADREWEAALALMPALVEAAPNDYFLEQIETAQVHALRQSGQAEDRTRALLERFNADSAGLSAVETGLLIALLDALHRPQALKSVLAAAAEQHPDSVPLARQAFRIHRRHAALTSAVAALERLMTLDPAREPEWLEALVLLHRDAQRPDAARAAAERLLRGHPQLARAHELRADVAASGGNADAEIEHLRRAIELSEQPHMLRLKLARAYESHGDRTAARQVYDDAFVAAESVADRHALMGPLTEAYFAEGRLEELIARFRARRQTGDDPNYGTYLAAIYDHVGDYETAREELTAALARRPDDATLLASLIRIAEARNDTAEALRFRERLTALQPTTARRIALAEAYSEAGRPDDVWRLLDQERDAFLNNPVAWSHVLPALVGTEHDQDVRDLLNLAANRQPEDLATRFAVAEHYLTAGDWEAARADLWEIVALSARLPEPPPTPSTTAAPSSLDPLRAAVYERMRQSQNALASINHLMRQAQPLAAARTLRYHGPSAAVAAGPLAPSEARDRALVYLAVMALDLGTVDTFLERLPERLRAYRLPQAEQLVALRLVEAWDLLVPALETALAQDELSIEMLRLYGTLLPGTHSTDMQERVATLRDQLGDRLRNTEGALSPEEQRQRRLAILMKGVAENTISAEDAAAEFTALRDEADLSDERLVAMLLRASLQLGLQDETDDLLEHIVAMPPSSPPGAGAAAKIALPQLHRDLLRHAVSAEQAPPPEVTARRVIALMRRAWTNPPARVPFQSTALAGMRMNDAFPAPNRYYDERAAAVLRSDVFNQRQPPSPELVHALLDELARETKRQPAATAPYPALTRIYLAYWMGDTALARRAALELLRVQPDDELRTLAAELCQIEDRPDEALNLLRQVDEQSVAYVRAQQMMLAMAQATSNHEVARRAATALSKLPLPRNYRLQLAGELQSLGMRDLAEEIRKADTSTRPASRPSLSLSQRFNQLRGRADSRDEALRMAERILLRDPLTLPPGGPDAQAYTMALEELQRQHRLGAYIEALQAERRAEPQSARTHLALALAYEKFATNQTANNPSVLAGWLRLEFTGEQIITSTSADGTTWEVLQESPATLTESASLGLALSGERAQGTVQLRAEDVRLEWLPAGGGEPVDAGSGWEFTTLLPDNPAFHASFAQGTLEMFIRPQDTDDALVMHRPVRGPFRLTARLADVGGSGARPAASLLLTSRIGDPANAVGVRFEPGRGYTAWYRVDGNALAQDYYARAAELAPENPQLLARSALASERRNDSDAAAEAYLALLRGGHYAELTTYISTSAKAIAAAGRGAELATVFDDLPAARPTSQRSVRSLPRLLKRVAKSALDDGQPETAVRLYAQCVQLEDAMNTARAETIEQLARALAEAKRDDEALELLAERLLPTPQQEAALGLARRLQARRPPLYQTVSIHHRPDGMEIDADCVDLISLATDLGLADGLQERLNAAGSDHYDARLAQTLALIARRDEAFAERLPELLAPPEDVAMAPGSSYQRLQVLLALADAMNTFWPERETDLYEPLREELAQATAANSWASHTSVHLLFLHDYAIGLAERLDRDEDREALMRAYAQGVRQGLLTGSGAYGVASLRAVELLLELGDARAAGRLLGLIRFQSPGGINPRQLEELQQRVDRAL